MTNELSDDSGRLAVWGFFVGGGFGVWALLQTLSDDSYEGARHHLVYGIVIFAVIGYWVGEGVERLLRKIRSK